MEAKKVAAEDVQHGVFSDHCLVATVGDWTMDLISWVPEKPENTPCYDKDDIRELYKLFLISIMLRRH